MRDESRRGGARQRQGELLEGELVRDDEVQPVRRRRLQAKHGLITLAVVLLLLAAWLGWRASAPLVVELPVVNSGKEPVELLLHGEGIERHALVRLASGERHTVRLIAGHGALRVRSEGERARVEAVLLDDARALMDAQVQLDVRSAGELILVPRSE